MVHGDGTPERNRKIRRPRDATSLGVQTVMLDHGLDLARLARDTIARGADCMGMAGEDSSQAFVAPSPWSTIFFECVAAGTRNHFPPASDWIGATSVRTCMSSAMRTSVESTGQR